MPLTSGSKLGPYQIQSALGAGGMGEVYRARDSRLGRDVAIKVLPPHLSSNPDLKQRFEREARAISSLTHPHICVLHDIGHQDGIDFLVMEYMEGETLAQRLKRAPLPIKETLTIAIELCEALDKAHSAGIIHRDLKPGNIMLTKNGAKLMDFGLAKTTVGGATSAASSMPLLSAAQTMSDASPLSPLTTAGAVVGTIQYMAPEQIEGKEADTRSDLFALGAVLYEMITGTRPFEGKSQISVASSILEKDPEPISTRQPLTPPALAHVVNACLAKNPEERFQTARDVRLELRWIAASGMSLATSPPSKARRQVLPWSIGAAAVMLFAIGALLLLGRSAPQPRYHMVTFREGLVQSARFSHDGQTIIYSGEWEGGPPQVSTARVGSPESRPLGIPSATLAAISSADELAIIEGCQPIFLLDCAGTLGAVNLAGGAPRQLAANVAYADWTPDGKELAIVVDAPNDARLESPPGHILYRQNSGWLAHPRFSPDGTLIAFENHPIDSDDGSIDVIDLQGKRRIVSDGWWSIEGLAWRPDGKEIWIAATVQSAGWADAIHAITLSGKQRSVLTLPWLRLLDISSDGRVLVARQNWRVQIMGLFPGDSAEHPYSWLDDSSPSAISSDGQWISFTESGEVYYIADDRQAYYRKTDGSAAVNLGHGVAVVSPDGKSILTYGRKNKLILQPVGIGTPRELPTPDITLVDHLTWSDDSQHIAYEGLVNEKEWNVFTQKVDGGLPVLIAPQGRNNFPVMSKDGSLLAIHDDHGGISLFREATKQSEPINAAHPAESPIRFANDDRSLLVFDPNGVGTDITLIDLANGHRQLWKHLSLKTFNGTRPLVVTPDLKYYAYSAPRYSSDVYLVEGLH